MSLFQDEEGFYQMWDVLLDDYFKKHDSYQASM